jgi:UDP-N-acetylglucosamine acyltransferase
MIMELHPTAIISERATLGQLVTVGPYSIIEPDTTIGDRCELRGHVTVKRFSHLGSDNLLHEGAVIGGEPQDLSFAGDESRLTIGARNKIREGVSINRGASQGSETALGSDCFIMAGAHVAHDCKLGDNIIIANNVALAGHVEIEDGAFISGGVVIHQFCRIGRLAMVGGNSKIVQDCLPFIITDGMPGRARGLNLVGLRRAGFRSADIQSLKQAYRVLLRSGLTLDQAIDELGQLGGPAVDHLISFVKKSKRGFCHQGTD